MLWIFHAIFTNEAKTWVQAQGKVWEQMPARDQWHLAWGHGPAELWKTIHQISLANFALATLVMGTTIVFGFLRWRMVLQVQGLNLSVGRAAEISLVAHFFNSFLLGSTGGDLIKAYYAARETHHRKTEAVVTVFADRLIGLWAMLLFAGMMMIPNWSLLREHEKLLATVGLVMAMLCACTVLVTLSFWGGVTKRWPGARERLRRLPKGEWLERSIDSCREFGKAPGFLLRTLAVSMLLNVACVIQFIILANGLGLTISWMALCLIVPSIICISALPITPSGLGVRENLFVLMLAVPELRVPATAALSLSLLAYAGSLFWSLVGGVVYVSLRERHHLKEVTEAPVE